MAADAELQDELDRAATTLRRRQASCADARERKALTRIIKRFEQRLVAFDRATAPCVAETLADAVEMLEDAVAAARSGPYDGYLRALESHFDQLSSLSGALCRRDALPRTPEGDDSAPPAAPGARSRGAPPAGADAALPSLPAGLQPPSSATDFAALQGEYAAWYAACEVRPERQGEVAYYRKRLLHGQAIYQQVGEALNIPWVFIGITHGMECGFNFTSHLHNGDPLGACTVHVPQGRPANGSAPFTWRESACDAMICKGYQQITDWSLPHMLYLFERYNGMGYRRRGVPTPYLWSYSNLYEKGKFVADGHFDPDAVSKQCGAALMLKAVLG